MLRRLHTRIIGIGAVCGLPPSPPSEVFLKTLPSPSDADPLKCRRFQHEEEQRRRRQRPAGGEAPEPFYKIVDGAAGHKHVALLTQEGNLIAVGDNRYGQSGAARVAEDEEGCTTGAALHQQRLTISAMDYSPVYIDLGGAFGESQATSTTATTTATTTTRLACGSNFTLVYQQGGRRVIAFGNNHMGQLGTGFKRRVDALRGFLEWDPTATWWPASRDCVLHSITCGYNHAMVQLSNGSLYAFGSNTWGELGIGTTDSPMCPSRITFFEEKGIQVRKVALGNSFTLFLSAEGRVYGCGATHLGQLPPNSFDPVPIPLTRPFQQRAPEAVLGATPTVGNSLKLIRVKDIACVGSLAVFLSSKNELLLQGSMPEFGVAVPSPRFLVVDQTSAIAALQRQILSLASCDGATATDAGAAGFEIVELVGGPTTLLVRYRNGCVASLGANTEGQLHNVCKVVNGKRINLAPAFTATELFPMLVPRSPLWPQAWFTSGKGFNLLLDNQEAYEVPETAPPIELPPGSGSIHQVAAASRLQRLRNSLK